MRKIGMSALAVALLGGTALMAGDVAKFMEKIYPSAALSEAVADMQALQGPDTALPVKTRELVSLAVAAQVPCDYCVYYHTEAAKAAGATERS